MPRRTAPLTETQVRRAKAKEKRYKLSDPGGLILEVHPTGRKVWKVRYKINKKEQTETIGEYPTFMLSEARDRRDEIKRDLGRGVDLRQKKKAEQAVSEAFCNSFEVVAREWWRVRVEPTLTVSHAKRQLRRLEMYVFPYLGDMPIAEIRPRDLLAVLRKIEAKGANETAHRVKVICGQVFRYAIVTERAERDIAAELREALQPVEKKHLPAITDPEKVRELMLSIDGYEGSQTIRNAMKLAPLVFLRPGELRHGEWSEIDLENKTWEIVGKKMKMKIDHIVPLSDQAVDVLAEQKKLTGEGRYIFPSVRSTDRPMSDNT